jgi:hypothetical protein
VTSLSPSYRLDSCGIGDHGAAALFESLPCALLSSSLASSHRRLEGWARHRTSAAGRGGSPPGRRYTALSTLGLMLNAVGDHGAKTLSRAMKVTRPPPLAAPHGLEAARDCCSTRLAPLAVLRGAAVAVRPLVVAVSAATSPRPQERACFRIKHLNLARNATGNRGVTAPAPVSARAQRGGGGEGWSNERAVQVTMLRLGAGCTGCTGARKTPSWPRSWAADFSLL